MVGSSASQRGCGAVDVHPTVSVFGCIHGTSRSLYLHQLRSLSKAGWFCGIVESNLIVYLQSCDRRQENKEMEILQAQHVAAVIAVRLRYLQSGIHKTSLPFPALTKGCPCLQNRTEFNQSGGYKPSAFQKVGVLNFVFESLFIKFIAVLVKCSHL